MRSFFIIVPFIACLLSCKAQQAIVLPATTAKEEIRNLLVQLNEAAKKHDRQTLEKIYADEFLFIHGIGFIDNKTEHIKGIMETDSVGGFAITGIDNLIVCNDDMAVLRNPFRGPAGNLYMGTTVYAKKNGHWQIIQIQGTAQQPERKWIKPDKAILDSYVGNYQQPTGAIMNISRTEDTLVIRTKGQVPRRLVAVGENQFFDKWGSMISFQKEGASVVYCLIRFQNGMETKWMRKEE